MGSAAFETYILLVRGFGRCELPSHSMMRFYHEHRHRCRHSRRNSNSLDYDDNRELINEVLNNENIMNDIKENIYMDETLTKLEKLDKYDYNVPEYTELYNDIISVGEYKL